MYNGTESQLRTFRSSTGATYPLLLLGASPTGGNLLDDYGPNDNYVVINKHGICRLNTYPMWAHGSRDRKSTRLNSSHLVISYAVFCLKKKKKNTTTRPILSTRREYLRQFTK